MSALSDYLENKILDHVLRGIPYTAPSVVYVGLLTAAPNDAGGGTEVAGHDYARAAINADAASWNNTQGNTSGASAGTDGTIENAVAVNFPTPSGAGWGLATDFAVYDALSGGNLLFYAPLTVPKTINPGDAVSFQPGSLVKQLG